MHELGITQEVVEIVCQRAGAARVQRIVLHIGKLSAVLPDAVRFCFPVCAEGTAAEGAELEIIEPVGQGRCRACGAHVPLERPLGQCGCGSTDLEWLSGDEIRITAMELA
jgi:hydrogenase nickel incorporation protein HypA/HybF